MNEAIDSEREFLEKYSSFFCNYSEEIYNNKVVCVWCGESKLSVRHTLSADVKTLLERVERESKKDGENKVWGQTYNFLYNNHKAVCNEWEDYLEQLDAELKQAASASNQRGGRL